MFIHLFLFFFLFLLLFFICRKISIYTYTLVFLLTKSEKVALWTLIILLLPGTIIHEVSHLIMATILRIPTGRLSIIPKVEKEGEIKTGKLAIGKTDPFRYTLVGLAPMVSGLALIYLIGKFLLPDLSQISTIPASLLLVISYMFFVISTTMFSSKKDLDSLIIVAPIVFLLTISFYLIGLRVSLTSALTEKVVSFMSSFNYFLLITNIIDFLVLLFLSASLTLWPKILGKKIKQV